jgi:hypothetical protein
MQPKYQLAPWTIAIFAAALAALAATTACKDADTGSLRRWRDEDASTDASKDAAASDASDSADAAIEPSILRLVGSVEDSDIRVAAVIENKDRARLFFCGGATSYATSTKWVIVPVAADGGFDFDADGWKVHGSLTRAALSGTVEQNDRSRRFSAIEIASSTIAGLYEGTADCGRVGLIVAQPDDDADPVGQGACVGDGHAPEQVNPILPVALKDGAIQVKIGEMDASVREAAPAPR